MNLYQFTWEQTDDECYSFFANTDRESIIAIFLSFRDKDGDIYDFDEFANYAKEACDVTIIRYCHEEPDVIHEHEIIQKEREMQHHESEN